MEARLTKEVGRMRNQVMSFTNEGAEFALNVPDTNEVKEVFTENVTVLVQCQKQITSLQQTMANMAEDHVKAQEALIAWSTDCMNGLANQNKELLKKLINTQKQMSDLSYNIQGYVDKDAYENEIILTEFDITPPGLFKTMTPKVIIDPKEISETDDTSTLFPTATGAEIEPSFREVNPNARQGGSITLKKSADDNNNIKQHRKTDAERAEAKAMYYSINTAEINIFPSSNNIQGRWKWAYRKIRFMNRISKLKLDMTRGKLPEHETLHSRLKRAEIDLFYQPIHMKQHVKEETTIINNRITNEVNTINTELITQKAEYTTLTTTLQSNIDSTNMNLNEVDKKVIALKEIVENGNKQMDDLEAKANKCVARLAETDQAIFNSLKGRIQESSEKVATLKLSSGTLIQSMEDLTKEVELMSIAETYANPADRMEKESEKLFEMLEFETKLRNTRSEIILLDTNSFSLSELLKNTRRDVLAMSILAGGDYEAIIPKSLVNELLAFIDSAHTTIDSCYETVSNANSLWLSHDNILSSKWVVLAGIAEAVKGVTGIADAIESMDARINERTTTEQVENISSKVTATAIEPVNKEIILINKNQNNITTIINETKESIIIVEKDLKTNINTLEKSVNEQVGDLHEAISTTLAEAATASNAAAAAAAAAVATSTSGEDGSTLVAASAPLPAIRSRGATPKFNISDIEADLEPMIKHIVDTYVHNNPSISRGADVCGSFFANNVDGIVPQTQEEDDVGLSFHHHELERVFDVSPDQYDDEIPDDVTAGGTPIDHAIGCLVKVTAVDHEHHEATGIVVGIEEVEVNNAGGNNTNAINNDEAATESKEDDDANADLNDDTTDGLPTVSNNAETGTDADAGTGTGTGTGTDTDKKKTIKKYRVAITPKTPVPSRGKAAGGSFGDLDGSFSSIPLNVDGVGGSGASNVSSKQLTDLNKQVNLMGKKIDDILSGRAGVGVGGGGSHVSQPFGGRSSPSNVSNGPSISDTQIIEMIQNSMKAVAAEIGDLRNTNIRDIESLKKQMKKALLTAINKAIIEESEKDKPSMLTTKSLCVGCGRPALVRKDPFNNSLASRSFTPSLNKEIAEGPDIYRGGFRMPLNASQKGRTVVPSQGPQVLTEDSLLYDEDTVTGGNTYSEILANIDHRDGVTNITDVGPGGMSISITSTTAPIRLSSSAKSIRHAQGKEEVAMLRPIHRKGMPGKSSENARKFVNKTWAPDRFGSGSNLSLSPSATSIKIPSLRRTQQDLQSMQQQQQQVGGVVNGNLSSGPSIGSINGSVNGDPHMQELPDAYNELAECSVESRFHP
jgi:hypothetical protein